MKRRTLMLVVVCVLIPLGIPMSLRSFTEDGDAQNLMYVLTCAGRESVAGHAVWTVTTNLRTYQGSADCYANPAVKERVVHAYVEHSVGEYVTSWKIDMLGVDAEDGNSGVVYNRCAQELTGNTFPVNLRCNVQNRSAHLLIEMHD